MVIGKGHTRKGGEVNQSGEKGRGSIKKADCSELHNAEEGWEEESGGRRETPIQGAGGKKGGKLQGFMSPMPNHGSPGRWVTTRINSAVDAGHGPKGRGRASREGGGKTKGGGGGFG